MKQLSKFLTIIFSLCWCLSAGAKEYKLLSPDGKLSLMVCVEDKVRWSALLDGKPILNECPVSLTLSSGRVLGEQPRVLKQTKRVIDQKITPVVAYKKSVLTDKCNELTLFFKDQYSITFRAYDYGAAYRFGTSAKQKLTVQSEQMELNFAGGSAISWFPREESYLSHNERLYNKVKIDTLSATDFCSLPVLFQNSEDVYVFFTEADLNNYPGMFLHGSGKNTLKANFPKQVLETVAAKNEPDRNEVIRKEAESIATVDGTRDFPWRVFYVTRNLGNIIENDLVYQLSRPLALEDTKWIKPGKVAWDWWNANNLYGVDFKAGLNTETYKYYIDFAAKYGLEYIILDEGWSKTTTNLLETIPDIDMDELVRYGNSKNVGVILWLLWKPLDKDMAVILDRFRSWGVKGIKIDFMQRSDQYMVDYYERVAREAAKRHLLVDFHGAFKPTGLHRMYPNVVSYEGVKGAENNKWSKEVTPEHNVTLPFVRNVVGPMDYTPGAMDNVQPKDFFARMDRPMSMGTRCQQIAMYVVFTSPLQMLADSPSNYYREKECTGFISQIPVTYDDTKVLAARVGEYVAIARKKGDKWYVGVMNNSVGREMELDFSFLNKGSYWAETMQDGINASQNGLDYKKVNQTVESGTKLKIKLASGGGWAAILSPK